MYKIIENYLPENDFDTIMNYINYPKLNWYFYPKANINSKENDFQFMHIMIEEGKETQEVKTISYPKLVPYLVDTIQQLNKRIEELEKKVK